MARTETVLSIFVASPGDVNEERNRLEETVAEWNRTWARDQGLRLELLRWETDAFPGIGIDAQDVINQQIPDNYDLFVGIMWSRFGTPTARAGSGTAEEFERALDRVKNGPDSPGIFFYFKDAPIAPSKIDTEQLNRVQVFKERLSTLGVLRWDFIEPDQFEKLVALHIAKFLQSRRLLRTQVEALTTVLSPPTVEPALATAAPNAAVVESSDEDAGYLDQLEAFEVHNAEVNAIAGRLTQAQEELTERTAKGTAQLRALAEAPNGATAAQARKLISGVAEEMLQFTDRVMHEVPLFRAAMSASMTALTKAATLSAEFDVEHARSAKTAAVSLLAALAGARQSMQGFRLSTLALPRITKELNAAKRKQASALESLIAEFDSAEQLLVEAMTVLDALPRPTATAR